MRKRSILSVITIIAAALLLSGCFTAFSVVEKDFKPRGKTIAVIPGINNDINLAIAALMSDSLQKHSRFQVMSQQQIARAVDTYPQNIKGPYKSAFFEIDVDWTKTDTQKIAALQRALKVDYLYVIWAPNSVQYSNNKLTAVHTVAQMFEAPSNKEVGQGHYPLGASESDPSYLKDSVDRLAVVVAQQTGMARQE